MFYLSAFIAITGAVGYQYFVKRIPETINPIVSVIGIYVAVLVLAISSMVLFPAKGGLAAHFRQLNWIQLAIAVTVFMIELGFLLMYRYGWDLSTGNLITGVVINLILVTIGVALLGEQLSPINVIGVALCIAGVVLVGYRP
jgi:drug/metabolite transporter (DMT)-like permease